METIAGPTLREGDAYFGNALLTRHVAGNVAHIDVSLEGREPRGIMHATLDIGGRRIELFNTHFGLQMRERSRQVERLLQVVEAADEAAILVVLGDFNEWRPRATTLAKLRAAFGSTPTVRSFPSSFPIFALDRVWVHPRPALKRIEVLRTPLARKASDHLPIYAEIAL